MKAVRRDFERGRSAEVDIPATCRPWRYTNEHTACTCPGCGRPMRVGEGYESEEYTTQRGYGYTVCWECREYENGRIARARKGELNA